MAFQLNRANMPLDEGGAPYRPIPVINVGSTGDLVDAPDASLTTGWAAANVKSCAGYGSALLQIQGLSGGDTIQLSGTIDGTNYTVLSGINLNTNGSLTTISADGSYAFPAVGSIKYAKTGVGSTPTVGLLLKR